MEEAKKADKPFFLWWNSTRMHIWTHLKKEAQGKTGLGIYPDGMVEHDGMVGSCSTSSRTTGPRGQHHRDVFHRQRRGEVFTWPDGGNRRSAARRTPTGRAATACPAPSAGPASSSPARCSTTSSRMKTCSPHLLAAAGARREGATPARA